MIPWPLPQLLIFISLVSILLIQDSSLLMTPSFSTFVVVVGNQCEDCECQTETVGVSVFTNKVGISYSHTSSLKQI